jgi:membrane protease subunit HflC
MRAKYSLLGIAVVALVAIGLSLSIYLVEEGKQAVVTQFGRPVAFVQEAGLHYRIPFIQEIHVLEKRLMPWDGAAENMQTRDKKRIFIDVWARWQITNMEEFFKAVRTERNGQKILDDLVDSAVRDVVAQNNLIDVVRSTNNELVYESEELTEMARTSETKRDVVTTGRAEMEAKILEVVADDLRKNQYGMELKTVRVKRVNYIDSVKSTVYERMRSERLRIASLFESEAEEEKNRIEGLTKKELETIEGEKEQKSAEIRGQADAEVIQMTADAFGRSPEFYSLLRRLEVFKNTLAGDTRLILTTDSELFNLLKGTGELPLSSGDNAASE